MLILNHDPRDFIETDLIAAAIVELRRTRRAWFAIAAAFSHRARKLAGAAGQTATLNRPGVRRT
jgi:hypothetical protein